MTEAISSPVYFPGSSRIPPVLHPILIVNIEDRVHVFGSNTQVSLKGPLADSSTQAALIGCQLAFVLLRPRTLNVAILIGAFLFTDLRNQPYRRADAVRRSVRRRFDDQNLRSVNGAEITM